MSVVALLPTWEEFKSIVTANQLPLRYLDHSQDQGGVIEVLAVDNGLIWKVNIAKDGGPDQVDFETNYKNVANTPLMPSITKIAGRYAGDDFTPISVTEDGKIRVDTTVSVGSISFENVANSTVASVVASVTSVMILASNADRKMATIYNNSTASLFLKLGGGASQDSFTVKLKPKSYYELPLPVYAGQIDGVWEVANGNALVTELF